MVFQTVKATPNISWNVVKVKTIKEIILALQNVLIINETGIHVVQGKKVRNVTLIKLN